MLLLTSQTLGLLTLQISRSADVVAGPVARQFCRPSFGVDAKRTSQTPLLRDSRIRTLPLTPAEVHLRF